MGEVSSATYSKDKGPSSNDQSFKGWIGIMSAEDMEVLNDNDNKDFCVAVSSGNVTKAQSMLDQKPDLAKIKMQNGLLPFHLAASSGHREMLQCLFNHISLDDLEREQTVQLFFITLKTSLYEAALDMLNKWPTLADSRDEEQLTALHVLARFQPEDLSPVASEVMKQLWELTRRKEQKEMLEFISKPRLLFDATKSGNVYLIRSVLDSNPQLLMVLDSKRRSLLHTAALYRRAKPLYYMIEHGIWKDPVIQTLDNEGNNILHMAGMASPYERFESSRPDVQIQRELLWFKAVEKRVPTAFKSMINKEGQTPKDIFYSTHRSLMVSAELAIKNKANYGMLVATIIATIVFAASLTVPGHDVSPEANFSILQKKGWFIIFILSDAVALFSSSSSIIFFLKVLTSSCTEDEFDLSLQSRLASGFSTLFPAIITMMIAFTAACFLIFNLYSTWVAYLVALLGFSTMAWVFVLFPLSGDSLNSLLWPGRLYHNKP